MPHISLIQALQAQAFSISLALAFLISVEHGCKLPRKQQPKQVDRYDILTYKNTEMTGLLEKDVSKVVSLKEFVTPNKIVTSKEIPSNI